MIRMVCPTCKKAAPDSMAYRCPDCGEPFELEFEARFPIDKIRKRKANLWRYREAIPIESDEDIVSFEEGFTPLLKFDILGTRFGSNRITCSRAAPIRIGGPPYSSVTSVR